ncbi:uncharacterized protein TNCV_3777511 [Trichonephila clavipes]|nr:uncharacterized protein TNCV_3777511 [Trichonephila clavipes]
MIPMCSLMSRASVPIMKVTVLESDVDGVTSLFRPKQQNGTLKDNVISRFGELSQTLTSPNRTMDWTGWSGKLACTLSCLDFFFWGHMKSLVYASPVDSDESLVVRIAVVAGDIRAPGYFLMFGIPSAGGVRPASLLEAVVASWSTTPSRTTSRSGISELCSEGREFQISPPEHNSVCVT